MQNVKKFEIIIERLHATDVTKALELAGVDGYTLLDAVAGKGDRGARTGDEITDVFRNSYIIAAVPVEVADRVIQSVRPMLKEFGGVCLISDAMWVKH